MVQKETEYIISLDIGAKCSAYCFGTKEGEIIKYGKYVANPGEDGRGEKLYHFSKWLARIINNLPYMPKRSVIETPYYKNNIKTYAVLNKYVAVAEREIYRILKITAEFIPPSAVKNFIGVPKGRDHTERKYLMVKEINKKLGMNLSFHKSNKRISDDDIADAIGLFLTFCDRLQNETP